MGSGPTVPQPNVEQCLNLGPTGPGFREDAGYVETWIATAEKGDGFPVVPSYGGYVHTDMSPLSWQPGNRIQPGTANPAANPEVTVGGVLRLNPMGL
jgi:hypothetical protein